jgi:GDSL-like lipase/acylhydrolase family protein
VSDPRQHVVLLGDSIFDNGAYTGGRPDVIAQLRSLLPAEWQTTLCAVDGATIADLGRQIERVPAGATHLVIAVGGNDALQNSDLLTLRVSSSDQALRAFAARLDAFERDYRAAIGAAVALGRRTIVCTVYNGALDPDQAVVARVALALFDDVILRAAVDMRLTALELRSICTERADYANPIEPSAQGGAKIAAAIARAIGAIPAHARPAEVWGNG